VLNEYFGNSGGNDAMILGLGNEYQGGVGEA